MSELKEYEVYINVGATQHITVSAESPEEAIENADFHASLCHYCSKEGLSIEEGDDFTVELDGHIVLSQYNQDAIDQTHINRLTECTEHMGNQDARILELTKELGDLKSYIDRFLTTKTTADQIALAEYVGYKVKL